MVAGQSFLGALKSVLVSTFVVHQGAAVFEPLARRMRDVPELEATSSFTFIGAMATSVAASPELACGR